MSAKSIRLCGCKGSEKFWIEQIKRKNSQLIMAYKFYIFYFISTLYGLYLASANVDITGSCIRKRIIENNIITQAKPFRVPQFNISSHAGRLILSFRNPRLRIKSTNSSSVE